MHKKEIEDFGVKSIAFLDLPIGVKSIVTVISIFWWYLKGKQLLVNTLNLSFLLQDVLGYLVELVASRALKPREGI